MRFFILSLYYRTGEWACPNQHRCFLRCTFYARFVCCRNRRPTGSPVTFTPESAAPILVLRQSAANAIASKLGGLAEGSHGGCEPTGRGCLRSSCGGSNNKMVVVVVVVVVVHICVTVVVGVVHDSSSSSLL